MAWEKDEVAMDINHEAAGDLGKEVETGCVAYRYSAPLNYPRNRPDLEARFHSIALAFVGKTTAHGFKQQYLARGAAKKIFWIVIMLASAGALTYNMARLIINFATYPVSTGISMNEKNQLTFPAITFCNMNPAKKSAIAALKAAQSGSKRKKRASGTSATGVIGSSDVALAYPIDTSNMETSTVDETSLADTTETSWADETSATPASNTMEASTTTTENWTDDSSTTSGQDTIEATTTKEYWTDGSSATSGQDSVEAPTTTEHWTNVYSTTATAETASDVTTGLQSKSSTNLTTVPPDVLIITSSGKFVDAGVDFTNRSCVTFVMSTPPNTWRYGTIALLSVAGNFTSDRILFSVFFYHWSTYASFQINSFRKVFSGRFYYYSSYNYDSLPTNFGNDLPLWISWDDHGFITAGYGTNPGINAVIYYSDTSDVPLVSIRSFAVSSPGSMPVNWTIPGDFYMINYDPCLLYVVPNDGETLQPSSNADLQLQVMYEVDGSGIELYTQLIMDLSKTPWFIFQALSCSAVQISLAPQAEIAPNSDQYSVYFTNYQLRMVQKIGGSGTSQTYQYQDCDIGDMSCTSYQWYWISWDNNGTIVIGCGNVVGQHVLLLYEDLVDPYQIAAVALFTDTSEGSNFTIPGYYNASYIPITRPTTTPMPTTTTVIQSTIVTTTPTAPATTVGATSTTTYMPTTTYVQTEEVTTTSIATTAAATTDGETSTTTYMPTTTYVQTTEVTTTSIPTTAAACLSGWLSYNGYCYFFSTNKADQSTASDFCASQGATLTSINDANELAFVNANRVSSNDVWIGLMKRTATVNGVTHWLDGSTSTFRQWKAGTPNSNDMCVRIDSGGEFNDKSCGSNLNYVCKMSQTSGAGTTYTTDLSTEGITTATTTTSVAQTNATTTTTARTTTKPTTSAVQTTTRTVTSSSKITTTAAVVRTTSEYVTTSSVATMTTTATNIPVQCCCRCCDQELPPASCSSCSRPSVTEAIGCATPTPAPPTPTRSPEPNFVAPETVAGSKFPDRLAPSAQFSSMQQFTEQIASLPVSAKSEMGFKLSDFIVSCLYDGVECDMERDFSTFYNSIHGNCYIYNSGWNSSIPLQQSLKPGISHGLSMVMNIQQSEYTAEAGDTAGIVVVIKQQNVMPFPEDEGLIVSPGHATSIGVTLTTIERLPQPYGDCWDPTVISTSNNAYADHYPVNYSSTACQKTCYQRNVISQCGCYDAYFPGANSSAFNYAKVPVCSTSNVTQGDCLYQISQMFVHGDLHCDCPDRCSDAIYSTLSSFVSWPAINSKVHMLRLFKSKLGSSFDSSDQEFVEKNLLKVDIFFSDFSSEDLSDSEGYPGSQFWTDTSGVMGLWYGFAMMTFVELIECLVDLIVLTFHRVFSSLHNRT